MQISNLIYVDQPTGTGFSYTSDSDDIRHDEQGVSNDLYDFLQVLSIGFFFFFRNDYSCPTSEFAENYICIFSYLMG